jgi:hypothetical protein
VDLNIKKIVTKVVSDLQKDKMAGGNESLWDYFTERLNDEGAWKQEDLALIENKINVRLNDLKSEELKTLWDNSATGIEKFQMSDSISVEDMKADLVNETLDRVMDKLGGIEGDYFREYSTNSYFKNDEKEDSYEGGGYEEEPQPDELEEDFDMGEDEDYYYDEDDEY